MMEISQKLSLKRILAPQMNQSLKILALPLHDLEELLKAELVDNPFLEEAANGFKKNVLTRKRASSSLSQEELDFRMASLTKKVSLQDALLRQLGMFTASDEEFTIGQEIIGNIDENGYLKTPLEEISLSLGTPFDQLEKVLRVIQHFDPPGVGARTVSECLLIQLELEPEQANLELLKALAKNHLDDIARKNFHQIAKALGKSAEQIQPLIKKIAKLNPKPGRNYSAEEIQQVIPDVLIDIDEDGELLININNEDMPTVVINQDYRNLLKNKDIDPATRDFLAEKLANALGVLNGILKRHATLRKIAETLAQAQPEAMRNGLSCLRPLTFKDLAEKINMHESTVCRAVMNKYAKLPYGVVALKEFFSGSVADKNGDTHSPQYIKKLITQLIRQEKKTKPLSDIKIAEQLSTKHNLKINRRTITKYREELKILNSTYRREK